MRWASRLLVVVCGPLASCATDDSDSGGGTIAATTEGSTSTATGAADESTGTPTTDGGESGGSTGAVDSTGAATCPDVEFVYNIATTPGLPAACLDAIGGNSCAATQTGCELSWGCNGSFEMLLTPGPIDADGIYVGEGIFMDLPFPCTLVFTTDPHAFEFECSGAGIVCTGSGF